MAVSERVLHFSLGPVQAFVAQARKTRDFWAGSFILSYLTGHALYEVIESGGKAILPHLDYEDPLMAAIRGVLRGERLGEGPVIATLPNRFMASIPSGFDPRSCVQAVERAWRRMAEAVWESFVAPVADKGLGTREIWERQVNHYWEIAWAVAGDEEKDVLERRKNWRSRLLPEEPGDKCTLMGNLQELSGFIRSRERKKQDAFWAELRKRAGGYEIDERERLSAIALIKRLFPLVAEKAIGWRVTECERYPSTPYLAAVPWLEKAVGVDPEGARRFAALAARLPGARYREDPDRFSCLQGSLEENQKAREFASLDGNCFFEAALSNPRLWDVADPQRHAFDELRRKLVEELREIQAKVGAAPSPFYALLLMDGDRMGALLRDHGADEVSKALNAFSRRVPEIVRGYNGITVYAGGDDLLAMLPLDEALKAAVVLSNEYEKSFSQTKVPPGKATISGALIYAHYNTPLTSVIAEAHRLLDDVAKDKTGRSSLAIAVWKGAGRVFTWAAPWQVIRVGDEGLNIIDELAGALGGSDFKDKEYNNTFFYSLRSRFEVLTGADGGVFTGWSESDVIDLFVAEYLKSRERQVDRQTARKRMERLLKICQPVWYDSGGNLRRDEKSLDFDGVLLVKFISQKGVEG